MKKTMTVALLALTLCAVPASCLAGDDSLWRDPNVSMKKWETVSVLTPALDETNAGDTFLADALAYELIRIGEDKLDDITYHEGEQQPAMIDAYLTAELLQYEKQRTWVNAWSDVIEQRYTREETYKDSRGNEHTRYITQVETDIHDYRPGYAYSSAVCAKISLLDPKTREPILTYYAADRDDKSLIDIFRSIAKDFYKKWKKEMKK